MISFLRDKKVWRTVKGEQGSFTRMGIFDVISRSLYRRKEEGSIELWASNLLRYDNEDHRLWISGNVWFAEGGNDLFGHEVDKSGYVISTEGISHQLYQYMTKHPLHPDKWKN